MSKVDTASLEKAVESFKEFAYPRSSDRNAPCKVKDLQNAVDRMYQMMLIFTSELEKID